MAAPLAEKGLRALNRTRQVICDAEGISQSPQIRLHNRRASLHGAALLS